MTLAALQALSDTQRFAKAAAIPAALAVAGIGLGLGEGLAIALGHDAPLLALSTVVGHHAFPLWLVATGAGLLAHPFFPARQTL